MCSGRRERGRRPGVGQPDRRRADGPDRELPRPDLGRTQRPRGRRCRSRTPSTSSAWTCRSPPSTTPTRSAGRRAGRPSTTPRATSIPGEQVEMRVGQSRLIRAQSVDTKFGSFEPGEVENYIKPIEMYIDHLAAITQTPAYYLKGKMANLSADALRAADAGLVDRCSHKILSFSRRVGRSHARRFPRQGRHQTRQGPGGRDACGATRRHCRSRRSSMRQ